MSKVLTVRVCCMKDLERWRSFNVDTNKEIAIVGKEDLETNYLLEDGVLYLKCGDYYDHLPEKMIAAFHAILQIKEFNDFTHIFKRDMDTGIKKLKLPNKLGDYMGETREGKTNKGVWHLKHKNYPGFMSPNSPWIGKKYTGKHGRYCLGGPGYILSRHSLEKICEYYNFDNLHTVKEEHIYEDVMVGILLRENKIRARTIKLL